MGSAGRLPLMRGTAVRRALPKTGFGLGLAAASAELRLAASALAGPAGKAADDRRFLQVHDRPQTLGDGFSAFIGETWATAAEAIRPNGSHVPVLAARACSAGEPIRSAWTSLEHHGVAR